MFFTEDDYYNLPENVRAFGLILPVWICRLIPEQINKNLKNRPLHSRCRFLSWQDETGGRFYLVLF